MTLTQTQQFSHQAWTTNMACFMSPHVLQSTCNCCIPPVLYKNTHNSWIQAVLKMLCTHSAALDRVCCWLCSVPWSGLIIENMAQTPRGGSSTSTVIFISQSLSVFFAAGMKPLAEWCVSWIEECVNLRVKCLSQ